MENITGGIIMKNIDWKRKLSSRKFWALVAGFVSSLLVLFNFNENDIAQVTAVITAFGSVAVYILGEAYVDGQRVRGGEE